MLTRRGVLGGFLSTSAAAWLGGVLDAPAQGAAPRVRVIDVHAHWYPPEWVELM